MTYDTLRVGIFFLAVGLPGPATLEATT